MIETVTAIRRVLAQGSSFPSVVETASGRLRVMKLAGAGPGRRALALARGALQPRLDLPPNHFLAGRVSVEARAREFAAGIDAADLGCLAAELPAPWLDDLGIAGASLVDRLSRYFESVRSS